MMLPQLDAWKILQSWTYQSLRESQVDKERKEAEAIKERVAKDEGAVATRQEQVATLCMISE